MDGQRFDELARLVATAVPRRRVLAMIAGGGGALGARISPSGATIICIAPGDPCVDSVLECCPGTICDGEAGGCVLIPICIAENETCGLQTAGPFPTECCEGLECVDSLCAPIEPTCAGVGEGCILPSGGPNLACCDGLVCLEGFCDVPEPACIPEGQDCDGDCCDGLQCSDGVCDLICRPEGRSCLDTDDVCCDGLICGEGWECQTCPAEGESCVVLVGGEEACCGSLVCMDGICTVPPGCASEGDICDADADCCAGICCGGACRDIECCIDDPDPNDRCADGQTCFEGVCQGVTEICESDDDCGDGACCCEDGGCSVDCCEEPVTQLPGTGTGSGGSGGSGKGRSKTWMAAAAGAAAAFVAGKKLKRDPKPAEATE